MERRILSDRTALVRGGKKDEEGDSASVRLSLGGIESVLRYARFFFFFFKRIAQLSARSNYNAERTKRSITAGSRTRTKVKARRNDVTMLPSGFLDRSPSFFFSFFIDDRDITVL